MDPTPHPADATDDTGLHDNKNWNSTLKKLIRQSLTPQEEDVINGFIECIIIPKEHPGGKFKRMSRKWGGMNQLSFNRSNMYVYFNARSIYVMCMM